MDKKYLSIKELSEYIGIKPKTLYSWVSRQVLPYYQIQGVLRFRKDEIEEWLTSCHKAIDPLIQHTVSEIEKTHSL